MADEERRNVTILINGKEITDNIASINREYRKQLKELQGVTRGTQEYTDKIKEIQRTKSILDNHRTALRGVTTETVKAEKGASGFIAKLKGSGGLGGAVTGLLGPLGSIVGLLSLFFNGLTKIREFSSGLDELQAITGATDEEMKRLKQTALETGSAVGKSGTEMVNAYKLVGSAKPELLENIDLLTQFTDKAIILSQASKEDLGKSVADLTAIMNANGASADQADRYINALAAGAQKGAKEIGYLAEAMTKYGPAADAAGLSIEQQVAAIETLGEKIPSASTAGTNFRNVLGELQKDTANYTDGVFDFNKSLENLAPIMNDNVKLQEIFGKENAVAAQILAQNTGRYYELTDAVTGTNTAYEQAAINQDNLNGSIARFSAKFDALILGFSEADGVIASIVDLGGDFLTVYGEALSEVGAQFSMFWTELTNLIDSFGIFNKEGGNSISVLDVMKFAVKATFVPLKALIAVFTSLYKTVGFVSDGIGVRLDEVSNFIKEWAGKAIGLINTVGTALGFDAIDVTFDIAPVKEIDFEGYKKDMADIWTNVWTPTTEAAESASEKLKEELAKQKEETEKSISDQGGIIEELEAKYKSLGDAIKKAHSVEEIRALQAEQAKVQAQLDGFKAKNSGGAVFTQTFETLDSRGPAADVVDPIQREKDIWAAKEAIAKQSMTNIANDQERVSQMVNENELQLAQERANFQIDMMKLGADLAYQFASNGIAESRDRQLEALDAQKEKGILNEQEYEKKKLAIQKQAFQKQKVADIAAATINGALAITKVQAQTGVLSPFTIPGIIATTLAQIATISATKFADGGSFLVGPSHSNGGMPVLNQSGQKVAELEGGEYIIRKQSVTPYTIPLLNAINERGSVDFNSMRAIKTMAAGGQFDVSNSPSQERDSGLMLLQEELRAMRMELSNWQRDFNVEIKYDQLKNADERKSTVDKIAKIRA